MKKLTQAQQLKVIQKAIEFGKTLKNSHPELENCKVGELVFSRTGVSANTKAGKLQFFFGGKLVEEI